MLFGIILVNSIVIYIISYLYYKFNDLEVNKKMIAKYIIIVDIIIIATLYCLFRLYPNNTFGDLFGNSDTNILIGGDYRYIPEIGETCFAMHPPPF